MDKYGLIGFPLGHSFSKQYFTDKFAREGIDAEYKNFEIPSIGMLPQILKENRDLCGLNVTIPYKRAVIPYLDKISEKAKEIGAVNVIRVTRNESGRPVLEGFNSDAIGFRDSIAPLLSPSKHNALIIGTGGASHAICRALSELGVRWSHVSRKRNEGVYCYEDLTIDIIRDHDIIINCSPVGMFPHVDEAPNIPYEGITSRHLLYDLIYNPEVTEFMKRGAAQGAIVKNGLEMLHLQAEASWEIWNNI